MVGVGGGSYAFSSLFLFLSFFAAAFNRVWGLCTAPLEASYNRITYLVQGGEVHSQTIVGVPRTMVLCLHGVCFKLPCAHVSACLQPASVKLYTHALPKGCWSQTFTVRVARLNLCGVTVPAPILRSGHTGGGCKTAPSPGQIHIYIYMYTVYRFAMAEELLYMIFLYICLYFSV